MSYPETATFASERFGNRSTQNKAKKRIVWIDFDVRNEWRYFCAGRKIGVK